MNDFRFDPKDAPRVLARMLQNGRLDRRTAPVRAMESIVAAVAGDWKGGLNAMPADARLLVDRLAILGVRLMCHERAVLAGEADPETDHSLIAMNAAFRKSLELLAEMRREHAARATAVPSIAKFCEERMRERAQNARRTRESDAGDEGDSN
jgi:hypothetical protein